MAGGTLESTFGMRTLTKAVQTFAQEPSQDFFQRVFQKGAQIQPDGRTAEWDEVTMPRNLAPIVGEDSPFPKAPLTDRKVRQSPMVHIKLSVDIPGSRLFYEREPGSLKDNAAGVIAQELAALTKRVKLTREYLCAQALMGTLDTGNVEGSEIDVSLAQTTTTATGGAWSTASTKIISTEIPDKVVAPFISGCGRLPSQAILNDVTEKSLLKNDEIRAWAAAQYGSSALHSSSASEKVMDGLRLGGLDWFKSIGGYVPTADSFTRFCPDNKIIVLPADALLSDTIGMIEGYGIVPRQLWGDAPGAGLIERAPSRGFYAFAEAQSNAPGVKLFVGWVGLPVLLFPGGILLVTVT